MSFALTELCMTENVSNLLTVLISKRCFKKAPVHTSTGNFQHELLKVIKSMWEVAVMRTSQYRTSLLLHSRTFKILLLISLLSVCLMVIRTVP
jgi:hypothetical protein